MPSGLLLIFLGFAFIFTLLYGIGLMYHWFRFGYMYPWVFVAMPIYLGGTALFFLVMLGALATL